MVRKLSQRIIGMLTLLVAAGIWLGLGTAAHAAPAAPTSITITGTGLDQPLTLEAEASPDLFAAVIDQVSWLQGKGQSAAPKPTDLGPKYAVVVHVEDVAKQTYELYPLAKGGPRAFRPANQPGQRKTTSAWFFGRLSMPETLRAAGVPLTDQPDMMHGGTGGGERVIPDDSLGSGEDIDRWLGELRRLMLLNGAVLLTITVGLAGISLLIRRRTR